MTQQETVWGSVLLIASAWALLCAIVAAVCLMLLRHTVS